MPKSNLQTVQEKLQVQAVAGNASNNPSSNNPSSNNPSSNNPSSNNPSSSNLAKDFIPTEYIARDLLNDSSTLPKTTRLDADKAIQSISEKRETLRLISANLQLNTDVYKVGSLAEKTNQSRIGYETDSINTQSKIVGLEIAGTNLQIAQSKLNQTQEKLAHQNIELDGLKKETPLRQQYWTAKLSLIESRIAQVELAKFQLDAKIGAIESETID